MKRSSLRILKILNRRNALTTLKEVYPETSGLIKVGIIESKSIIPQALKMYLSGLGAIIIRVTYSIVKIIVNIH